MKTIKFRAWDKKKKVMLFFDEQWLCSEYSSLCFRLKENQTDLLYETNPKIFMQFTGLKDKNGKEIYCGDIVKGYFDENKVEDYIWLSLTDEEKVNGYRIFIIPDDIVDFARSHYPDELKVIGNIYENPELLK